MISVDANQTTNTFTYEVQQFAIAREMEISAYSQDVQTSATFTLKENEGELLRIVSNLWLGKRVGGLGTETHTVTTAYEAFQPKAYNVQAARAAVAGLVVSTFALVGAVALWGPPALWGAWVVWVAAVHACGKLPDNSFEHVTHDVKVEVPVEVAYYIDPTLPSPKTWGGPSYTRVVWEDGTEHTDHMGRVLYEDAVRESDPLAYFDDKVGWPG